MIDYQTQNRPSKDELFSFFDQAFLEIIPSDGEHFAPEQKQQSLTEWFSVEGLLWHLPYGELWEARNDQKELVGAAFEGKQNPMSWPDGNKAELFILAVKQDERGKGIGKELVVRCEGSARLMGAKTLIVNTHSLMTTTTQFYSSLGYREMGTLHEYYANGDAIFLKKDL